ncbi:guanyl-nucleotide exchange factor Ste6 [Schizosaccharomyces japonicus yFS275]|uniref:Guanyl-nucleotide exchange factor Ste6 n=1 Tax=Schizosaccharomyces japonicus (strain yFS275 / FY16936) TaxID=402676 RepID=B6K2L9_SCHJY|nr:guanyl-nucleotide exchange factor Ste6 [Schizosaccharomyces japonicus yFS275]EEB07400.1 guanyl-nucleotide exchange factor Ste6 [Schizosaccharomyces japonicus yFS275]
MRAIAVEDYQDDHSELPQLSFSVGDIIHITEVLENGWLEGVIGNQKGYFPASHVEFQDERTNIVTPSIWHFPDAMRRLSIRGSICSMHENAFQYQKRILFRKFCQDIKSKVKALLLSFSSTQELHYYQECVSVLSQCLVQFFEALGQFTTKVDEGLRKILQLISKLMVLPYYSSQSQDYQLCYTAALKYLGRLVLLLQQRTSVSLTDQLPPDGVPYHTVCFVPVQGDLLGATFDASEDASLELNARVLTKLLLASSKLYKRLSVLIEIVNDRISTDEFTDLLDLIKRLSQLFSLLTDLNLKELILDDFSVPSLSVFTTLKDTAIDDICELFLLVQTFMTTANNDGQISPIECEENLKTRLSRLQETLVSLCTLTVSLYQQFCILREDMNSKSIPGDFSAENLPDDASFAVESLLKRDPINEQMCSLFVDLRTQNNLRVNANGRVLSGNLYSLFCYLFRYDLDNSNYTNVFFLTYNSFTNSLQLSSFIAAKLFGELKQHSGKNTNFGSTRQVRRMLQLMLTWLELKNGNDLKETEFMLLMNNVYGIIHALERRRFDMSSMKNLCQEKLKHRNKRTLFKNVQGLYNDVPKPLVPPSFAGFRIYNLNPMEVARQLTLIEFRSFLNLTDGECLMKMWDLKNALYGISENEGTRAVCFCSNQLVSAIIAEIVEGKELKIRKDILAFYICLASALFELQNFASLFSVISALNSSPVHRLKKTWGILTVKQQKMFQSLEEITNTSKNYLSYRECLERSAPPCLPFMGVFMTDITFLKDGNRDKLENGLSINFEKRWKFANLLNEIRRFQSVPYAFEPVEHIQEMINKQLEKAYDADKLYAKSLAIEPREQENRQMQRHNVTVDRLLKESGFL